MPKLNAALIYRLIYIAFGFSTMVMHTTYVVYRVEVAGLDALQLVLLGTALEVSIFLFEIPTGVVADVYSRRLSIIIGVFLVGIGHAIEGVLPAFSIILLSQVVWGIGHTFISGALDAWVTDEVGAKKVGPIIISGNQLEILGSLVGIPIGVWTAQTLGLAFPYFLGGGLLVLLGLLLIVSMPEHGFKPVPVKERQGWRTMFKTFNAGLQTARRSPALLVFGVAALFMGLYSEAWDRLAQPYLLQVFTFPALGSLELTHIQWFGVLNVIFLLVGLLANQIAKRAVDTTRGPAVARGLQVLYAGMVISMLFFSLTGNFILALLAMVAFNGLRRVTFPLTRTWINQQIPAKSRATVLSMAGQIDALGELSGGPILGTVGRLYSMRAALIASAIVLTPVVALFQRIVAMTQTPAKKKSR
ncbi:MAG: MFS transporter [Anaerolineales bacterium]|nr:MFS transporter [Anaerolineales bacterium]